MATELNLNLLETLLSSNPDDLNGSPRGADTSSGELVTLPEGQVDPRFKRMSYSSGLLFNGCERKFQLQKLNQSGEKNLDLRQEITFGFGHMIGEGLQLLLQGWSRDKVIIHLFTKWKTDLFRENEDQKKSFFYGMWALDKFMAMMAQGFLEDYELAYYDGKPAVELSYRVTFPDGFKERGYVDVVMRNKFTGKLTVFEVKTDSSWYLQPQKYKNSSQAIGYSVVLDKIESGNSDYTVKYLVFMTRQEEWEVFEFPHLFSERANWVENKLYDFANISKLVELRGNYGTWPQRGSQCMSYNRECDFFGTCHLPTERLVPPLREGHFEEANEYQFELDWSDLITFMEHANA